MELSVLIPTRGRGKKLARCVAALARQTLPGDRYEVVVAFDGPDGAAREACERAWAAAGGRAGGMRVLELPHRGYTVARNELIQAARGRVMVSLNDDVRPSPEFLGVHAREQQERTAAGRPAVVVGHSPYVVPERDTLLNRLVRETGMVFFYDAMNTPEGLADRERDWGFRHCFGLNFSAPMELVRAAGGFTALEHAYGYDDIELAHRLGMPVIYRPEALAEHDHAYTTADILDRERALGRAAWAFAGVRPGFARDLFGRDIRSAEEVEYSRQFVARERATAGRLRGTFEALGELPPTAVPAGEGVVVRALAEQHVLLKRWCWRAGLLEGAGEGAPELG